MLLSESRHPNHKTGTDQSVHGGGGGGGAVPLGRGFKESDVEWSDGGRTGTLRLELADGRVGTVRLFHASGEPTWGTETDRFQTMEGVALGMRHMPTGMPLEQVDIRVTSAATDASSFGGSRAFAHVDYDQQIPERGMIELNSEVMSKLSAWGHPIPAAAGGMGNSSALTRNSQIGAHEMGHVIDFNQRMTNPAAHRRSTMLSGEALGIDDPITLLPTPRKIYGLSDYGRKSKCEAYAECFLEWTASGGKTTNEAALAMQEVAGWT